MEKMAAPVRIQTAKQSVLGDQFLQAGQHAQGAFLLHQVGGVDFAGGVVQKRNQVLLPVLARQPGVRAAVHVHEQAAQGAALALAAVRSVARALLHQARRLQGALDPLIAQLNAVLLLELFVKMAHVEIGVLLPIEAQHALGGLHRHSLGRRPLLASVKQAVIAMLFITPAPAPQGTRTPAQDVRGVQPTDLAAHGPTNDLFSTFITLNCSCELNSVMPLWTQPASALLVLQRSVHLFPERSDHLFTTQGYSLVAVRNK